MVLFHDDKETLLGKGEHTFEFLIIVPSSTASYERCQHGRVRHSIMAKAKGPGLELSDEKPLFLVVNVRRAWNLPGIELTTALRGIARRSRFFQTTSSSPAQV